MSIQSDLEKLLKIRYEDTIFGTVSASPQASEPLTIEKLKETYDMLEREFPVNCALARLKNKYTNLEIKRMMQNEE